MFLPRTRFVPPTHQAALAMIAGLILAGCDSNRPRLSTAPVAESEVEASAELMPQDVVPPGAETSDVEVITDAMPTTLGGAIGGLDPADLARFVAAQEEFVEEETIDTGLGPVFNDVSCGSCHANPLGGTNARVETRFGRWIQGKFDPMADHGGSLIQDKAIGPVQTEHGAFTFVPEVVPSEATVRAGRITTGLFGLGLVDAVPDATFRGIALLQIRYSPSTRGRAHRVTEVSTGATRVGRFGWKAQVPTLHQFSGDAYLNEMGITNPDFPTENSPQGNAEALAFNPAPELNDDGEDVQSFLDFMTLLGPPPRRSTNFLTDAGGYVFWKIGCANCHIPTLTTGDSPVPALSHKRFHPYSDFLLHDMGELGDGIVQGNAGPREMRTAPLWGLGSRSAFLHDGRARTLDDAIAQHSGQGSYARNRYFRLGTSERWFIRAFLRSL